MKTALEILRDNYSGNFCFIGGTMEQSIVKAMESYASQFQSEVREPKQPLSEITDEDCILFVNTFDIGNSGWSDSYKVDWTNRFFSENPNTAAIFLKSFKDIYRLFNFIELRGYELPIYFSPPSEPTYLPTDMHVYQNVLDLKDELKSLGKIESENIDINSWIMGANYVKDFIKEKRGNKAFYIDELKERDRLNEKYGIPESPSEPKSIDWDEAEKVYFNQQFQYLKQTYPSTLSVEPIKEAEVVSDADLFNLMGRFYFNLEKAKGENVQQCYIEYGAELRSLLTKGEGD